MYPLLLFLGISSSVMARDKKEHTPLIIAHRGASGYEPENTLRAFVKAIEMGAQMIELDVYLSKSGDIIVIHDETLERTTNGKGNVKELSTDYLQSVDAGKGEHIPLLAEVFDLVNKRTVINIEIKDLDATKAVAELITTYVKDKKWSYDQFLVSSFEHQAIKDIYRYNQHILTGALFDVGSTNEVAITKDCHAQYVIVDASSVTKQLIGAVHAAGLQLFTYTVNNTTTAKQFKEWGIDGIITNYPNIQMLNNSHFEI